MLPLWNPHAALAATAAQLQMMQQQITMMQQTLLQHAGTPPGSPHCAAAAATLLQLPQAMTVATSAQPLSLPQPTLLPQMQPQTVSLSLPQLPPGRRYRDESLLRCVLAVVSYQC